MSVFVQAMIRDSGMTVSAWRNTAASNRGKTRFGLTLGKPLRDRLLKKGVDKVTLHLKGGPTLEIRLKDAFWNSCPEFKHPDIGPWLYSQGIPIPWPPGKPPKFKLVQHGPAEFEAG